MSAGAPPEQRVGELGARVEEVLAVVEHEQRRPIADADRDASHEIAAQLAFAEGGCDRRGDALGVGERRELDEPGAAAGSVEHVGRELHREARSCRSRPRR